MFHHRARRLLALAVALVALVACGSDEDRTTTVGLPAGEDERSEETVVTMERSRFEPREFAIAAGEEITFRNLDAAAHTVTSAEGAAVAFDSDDLGEGDEFVVRFDEPGAHEYFCEIHPTMRGTVVVE